jgi:DNA polymerase III subunit epsilon
MLPKTFSCIDVETTGCSPAYDRIIEIGIIKVENNTVTKTLSTLINPERSIPREITLLTGITEKDLENAPTFSSIKDEVRNLTKDVYFVAHNARFDYSFIKSEFLRLDESFSAKLLCTAKLSRTLFPNYRHHNLDSIIERFNIHCSARHRALGDAEVLVKFLHIIEKQFDESVLDTVLKTVLKRPTLPPTLTTELIDSLPEKPGVYTFYDQKGLPIYIGKSKNIKDRVVSHFLQATTVAKETKIFQSIYSIETKTTDGELGALLLESQLIKQHQPLLNRKLKQTNYFLAITQDKTTDGYLKIKTQELSLVTEEKLSEILAIFRTKRQLEDRLLELAEEFKLCKKLLGIEKSKGNCFGYHLGTCNGACVGKELPVRYNLRFTEAFIKTKIREWPFSGPIAIREGDTTHIIFRWCYVRAIDTHLPAEEDSSKQPLFDYDAYKILSSFLLNPSNLKNVKILPKIP